MRVDTLLTDLLRATVDKAAAGRRVDLLRDRLDTEARRRYADEGAAPSWKAPQLGTVRLDPKPAKAYVADPDAFASYVAERFPGEVTARIELPAGDLPAALEALGFVGVTVHRSAVEVRPTFAEALLGNAEVLYDATDPANVVKVVARLVDGDQLEAIAGADVLPPSATLVVSLDRAAKATTLARVEQQLEAELADEVSLGTALLEELDAPRSERTGVRTDRTPYVGDGADGARRSAEVDRTELEGMTLDDPRRPQLEDSLVAWEEQAARLEAAAIGDRLIARAGELEADAVHAAGRVAADSADLDYGQEVAASVELTAATDHPGEAVLAEVAGIPVVVDPTIDPDTAVLRREGEPDVVITPHRPAPAIPYTARPGMAFAPRPGEPGYALMPAGAVTPPAPLEVPIDDAGSTLVTDEAAAIVAVTGPELMPGGMTAPEASSVEPTDEGAVAAALAAEGPIAAGDTLLGNDPVSAAAPPLAGEVDPIAELAKLGTDDLKRAARAKRLPISGTKVLLATKLHKAGVTPLDVLGMRPTA